MEKRIAELETALRDILPLARAWGEELNRASDYSKGYTYGDPELWARAENVAKRLAKATSVLENKEHGND